MKKHLSTILLVLILLVGAGVMLYPTASDYWNSFHQRRAIASYSEGLKNLDTGKYERLLADAQAYNQDLLTRADPFKFSEEEDAAYRRQLSLQEEGGGVIGSVQIPKINVDLPIYLSTDESVLQTGIGHVEGSSLPVGGPSTHAVLSGHRGLPSATLFTNLDQVAEGDVFQLGVLGETMTYQVDRILVVEPEQTEYLAIEPGQDYCTLITCTPYGINTHRILVRGHRIENQEAEAILQVTGGATRIDPIILAPIAAIPLLLVLGVWLAVRSRRKKRGGVEN